MTTRIIDSASVITTSAKQTSIACSEACIACGSAVSTTVLNVRQYQVKECLHCRLQFLSPQPTDKELARIYGENYFFTKDVGEEEQSQLKRATARLYLDHIACATEGKKHGQLLEIGCGNGYLLFEAMNEGYSIAGIEYSQSAAGNANSRLGGVFVRSGNIDLQSLPQAKYDVVIACDVVAQVREPREFIEAVYRTLAPSGIFYCVTPSLDSFTAKQMRTAWVEYKEEHLYYFNSRTLSDLLTQSGFTNLTQFKNYKVLSPRYIAAHFNRFPQPVWTQLASIANKIVPSCLMDMHVKVVASGIAVCAQK